MLIQEAQSLNEDYKPPADYKLVFILLTIYYDKEIDIAYIITRDVANF